MEEITLEKVDAVRERTGVTYAQAKEALIKCNGDVLEAIIYLENNYEKQDMESSFKDEAYTTLEELKLFIKKLVEKGNVSRIVVKKEGRILVDVPVNAGIAAGVIAVLWPPILAIALITTVAVKLTIEVTKDDGSVEVINTVVKNTMKDVKGKMSDFAEDIKGKYNEAKGDFKNPFSGKTGSDIKDEPMYTYTVKFDQEDDENKD
ncbi:DUF4342 domain-containing protein [Clostridium polynesiense]|uniref:DUF4342 domain-containing protein n=1 Tax=Clostridium polynesiense TaxID=1325933 RepID=UPI00058E9B7F|nr:DUF4342 domain-containing protein [Clostridium polynesiense]